MPDYIHKNLRERNTLVKQSGRPHIDLIKFLILFAFKHASMSVGKSLCLLGHALVVLVGNRLLDVVRNNHNNDVEKTTLETTK